MPKYHRLPDFTRGWFIGDFEPAIMRTKDFEISIISHVENEVSQQHLHTSSTEINVVVSGSLRVNGRVLNQGDIFVYEPYEVSDVQFLANSTLCVVRVPSAPNDKVLVE